MKKSTKSGFLFYFTSLFTPNHFSIPRDRKNRFGTDKLNPQGYPKLYEVQREVKFVRSKRHKISEKYLKRYFSTIYTSKTYTLTLIYNLLTSAFCDPMDFYIPRDRKNRFGTDKLNPRGYPKLYEVQREVKFVRSKRHKTKEKISNDIFSS